MALGPIKSKAQVDLEKRQRAQEALARLNTGQVRGASLELPENQLYKEVPTIGQQNIPVDPAIGSSPQRAVDEAIAAGGTLDPQIAKMPEIAVKQQQFFNPATNKMTTDESEILELSSSLQSPSFELTADREQKEGVLETELSTQANRAVPFQSDTLESSTSAELLDKPEMEMLTEGKYIAPFLNPDRSSADVRDDFDDAITDGKTFNNKLPQIFSSILTGETELDVKVQNALEENGIFDPTSRQLNPKLGQGLVFAQALLGNEMLDKENELLVQRKKAEDSAYSKGTSTEERAVDANMVRYRLADEVVNLIGENPNRLSDEVNVGFGGAGTRLDPEVKSALNALFTKALSDSGMFTDVPLADGSTYTTLSDYGALFSRKHLNLLIDMGMKSDIDTSASPTLGGSTAPGRAKEAGFKRAGDRSRKTLMDSNTAKLDLAKSILGSIPQKVIQDRYLMAKLMVNQTVSRDPESGRIELLGVDPVGGYFSNRPFAATLGLDEKKWNKAYQHALKTQDENASKAQADMVLRQEARKVLKILEQGNSKSNEVFYNKIFDADTVGRLFFRNTVLNTQDSKSLARMFVGNAIDTILNPSKDNNSPTMESFMYITGRNLLDSEIDLNGKDVEDMGWTAILDATKEAFSNSRYDTWVSKGNKLKEMLNAIARDPQANLSGFATDPKYAELFQEFKKKGEWGYKYQSYIDIANYDAALKSGKSFKAQAQTQHDGKQNGIAIQAMQMGNKEILERTGLIFSDENNVLPWGDVRTLFGQRLGQGISYAIKEGGLTEDKENFWNNIFVGPNSKMSAKSNAEQREILKLLSKQPLMEISYGRYFLFNEETASEFINDLELTGELLNTDGYQGDYSPQEMIKDLNLIIAGTVKGTLNFKHQALFKKAGKLSAMLGVPLGIQGPMGNTIYMGSTEQAKTGKLLDVDTGVEVIQMEMYEPRVTGSAKMSNRRLVQDEFGNWEIQQAGSYGQEVANQLPVLPIQQIDAAIMVESLTEINRASIENSKAPLFVIPVHDAIITDASSVKRYHQAMNRNFVKVNKRYSLTQAIREGLENTRKLGFRKLNDSEMYDMNDESVYRAIHEELARLQENKINGVSRVLDDDGVETTVKAKLTQNNESLLKIATEGDGGYWNADGTGKLSGLKIKKIIELMFKRDRIMAELLSLHKRSETNRGEVFQDRNFQEEGGQYN